jgi:hypothetical protein
MQGQVGQEYLEIFQCQNCHKAIVVVEQVSGAGGPGGEVLHAWPALGAADLDAAVPANVADSYLEGVRCLGASAPNGGVAMFRNAIAYMVEDKGSVEAKSKADLKAQIKQMIAEGGPLGALGDWADHVRLFGNAGAHPNLFGAVTQDEAEEVLRLVRMMIELLYEVPARIARQQQDRRAP